MIALGRPAPDSSTRPFFNWLHWGLGLGGWGCASLTILLSVPLGKTGLYATYGPIPFYIMCSYLLFFVAINIALQIVTTSHEARQEKKPKVATVLSYRDTGLKTHEKHLSVISAVATRRDIHEQN
ncbi:unnamed protein product, partial [Mesorhabditis spiculigera]